MESTVTITLSEYNALLKKAEMFDSKTAAYVSSPFIGNMYGTLRIVEPTEVQKLLIDLLKEKDSEYTKKVVEISKLKQEIADAELNTKLKRRSLW